MLFVIEESIDGIIDLSDVYLNERSALRLVTCTSKSDVPIRVRISGDSFSTSGNIGFQLHNENLGQILAQNPAMDLQRMPATDFNELVLMNVM